MFGNLCWKCCKCGSINTPKSKDNICKNDACKHHFCKHHCTWVEVCKPRAKSFSLSDFFFGGEKDDKKDKKEPKVPEPRRRHHRHRSSRHAAPGSPSSTRDNSDPSTDGEDAPVVRPYEVDEPDTPPPARRASDARPRPRISASAAADPGRRPAGSEGPMQPYAVSEPESE